MVIAEQDIPGKEEKIHRIAAEVRVRLHQLARKDPRTHALQRERHTICVCEARGADKIQQRDVGEQREVREARQVYRVHAPRLLDVYSIQEASAEGVSEEARGVGSPRRPHPPETLAEIPRVGTDSGLNHRVVRVLEFHSPALADHPAGNEVVIVRVEGPKATKEEPLVLEFSLEGPVGKNLSAVGGGAPRDDEDPAVDVVCCRDFEVVPLQVQAADEVPEALEVESGRLADNTLVSAHDADVGVLERGEDCGQEIGAGPEDGGVDADHDTRFHVRHRVADLHPLVAFTLLDDADLVPIRNIEGRTDHLAQREVLPPHRRDDDGCRPIRQDRVEALSEFLVLWIRVRDRDDDRAVAAHNRRVSWDGDGFIQVEGNHVHEQAGVSPEEEGQEPEVLGVVDGHQQG